MFKKRCPADFRKTVTESAKLCLKAIFFHICKKMLAKNKISVYIGIDTKVIV